MRKLLLIMLFIGSLLFSTKISNTKSGIKKIPNKSFNFKNKINSEKNTSILDNITGPRYRIDGTLGIISYKYSENLYSAENYISTSISFLSEWKTEINKKFDITFGPKITLNISSIVSNNVKIVPSLIFGVASEFNYRILDNFKVYTGIEFGGGLGNVLRYSSNNLITDSGMELLSIAKISLGFKLNDKYNVALYTGSVKGLIGIEVGYTF